jgi:hypothetical protein
MNTFLTYFSLDLYIETPDLCILPKSTHPAKKKKNSMRTEQKTPPCLPQIKDYKMADLSRFFPGLGLGAAAPTAAPPLAQPAEQVQKRKCANL